LWSNRVTEVPLDSVEVDGKRLPVRWKFKPEASSSDAQKVAYVYESSSLKLRMTSEWIARADYGPVEHQIKIENLDSREVWIPFVDSIQLDLTIDPSVSLEHFYVDKGAGAPSPVGTHQLSLARVFHWLGTSSRYAEDGEPREIIPWSFVQRTDRQQSAWYVGIEFSGRTRIELKRQDASLRANA